ncbi:MAG: fasciclin domain-containing protein [Gammaproteobacteria bacterium]|nr:fasciclin domain-containing protein [Gammaproteobacteria bacterium]
MKLKNKHKLAMSASLVALSLTLVACSSDDNVTVVPDTDAAQHSGDDTITDTAVANGSFTTLVAALQATGLDEVLADEDSTYTVFAPNDDAFAKLGQDTINSLLNDTDQLRDILLYHVVADAEVDAATAVSLAGTMVDAANGDKLAVSLDGSDLFINMSQVIATDIAASNGIIHVIDTVLIPPTDPDPMQLSNIVDTAVAAGTFNTLAAALTATGLDATLADESQSFTVFAPTDDAFALLGDDTINGLLADTDTLSSILLYHVLSGSVDSTTALSLAGTSVPTVNGADLALSIRDGNLFVNDSQVVTTDIMASNGIIHVIDAVLTPPAATPPSDDDPIEETPTGTIFDVASEAGFSTLVAAVKVAGLEGALDHPNDFYTVFAPTDAAFAALGQSTIDSLLADPDALRNILLYHILPGTVVDSSAVPDLLGFDIQSGNGQSLVLSADGGILKVNDATITATDVRAVNGVIHVIDRVLIPPAQ